MKTLTKIMFYIPKKFLIKLIFILFLLLSFNIYVNAATLTSYNDTYNLAENQSCGSSGKYTYYLSDDSTLYSGSINSTITGKATALYFDFRYDLTANTYYDVSINGMLNDFTQNVVLSSFHVANGTSCGNYSSNNVSVVSLSKSASSGQFKTIKLRIYASTSVDYWFISIFNDNNSNLTGVSNFGISSLSIVEVDMSNTDAILNNQNSNTDSIINNNNSNTNDIIDNQNQNNEELKDTINDNFNSCTPVTNLIDINNFYPFSQNTTLEILQNGVLVVGGNSDYTGALYDLSNLSTSDTYTLVVDYKQLTTLTKLTISIDGNIDYFTNEKGRYTYSFKPSSSNVQFGLWSSYEGLRYSSAEFTNIALFKGTGNYIDGQICSNKLDDTNDKLDNINGTLTDGSPPDTESFMEHLDDLFYDGPISTLILMPLTLINHYVDGFNSTCSPINLGSLYGTDLNLPCINLESKLGSSLWTTIDGLVSIFMIYNICMLFVSAFNDITSLRDTFDSLYVPQHGKPLGKHTSEVE